MAVRLRLRGIARAPVSGWAAAAWLIVVAGVAVAVVAAGIWRNEVEKQGRRQFDVQAAQVGAATTAALRQMDDLIVSERALLQFNSSLTNRELRAWYRNMDVTNRYRGKVALGYIEPVRPADVDRFAKELQADPPADVRVPRDFHVVSLGQPASYCLLRLSVNAAPYLTVRSPEEVDWCAVPGFGVLPAARDSGQFATFQANFPKRMLTVWAPLYRGARTPPTVRERRARLIGWVAGIFDLDAVLGPIVAGHRLQISIARQDRASRTIHAQRTASPITTVGSAPKKTSFRRRFVVDADGRWIVSVVGAPAWGALSPSLQGAVVLATGLLASGLVFLLVLILGRGRAHALRLVTKKTEQLRHQALHDALTGLPNRTLIADRTAHLLSRARRDGFEPAALFVDLDGFKAVNDTFGHPVGDELLQAVATRIASVLRESDTVGRLGGDEFVVLVEGGGASPYPELVAERLLGVLREPFELDGVGDEIVVTTSIGIATGERTSGEELLRDADIALYEAKATGKDRSVVFRKEMHLAVQDRIALEHDLRAALELGQLSVVYQPTFALADGTVTGLEALARWHHPKRGLILPDGFVPIAEATGQIVEIGRFVLETVARQAAAWHAEGYPVDVAVNVSMRQLEDPDFAGTVRTLLEEYALEPSSLTLEITETALMHDAEAASARLAELKEIGVRLAIDDFGTGYSSLAYLRQLPVDALKIDRLFVAEIARSRDAKALIGTLVQLGKTLRLDTVAEGIEDEEQLARLRAADCHSGQGFLLGRPLGPAEIPSFLATHLLERREAPAADDVEPRAAA
jgi:diguanylate cyclase (GGDEF)-like protein